MKDEHIIREFVRTNFQLLTSMEFERRPYKAALSDLYVRKYKSKYSVPSNRDCMVVLISVLKGHVPESQIRTMIETLPFFKETGERERQSLLALIHTGELKSVLPDEQLNAIREVGAFEAVTKHKGKEIEEQAQRQLQELEKQIEQKRTEYEALPSVLDQEVIEEPEFRPELEEIKPWWERFYLTGDPFPLKDGLSAIPKELYEQVIIKTEPFQGALGSLHRNPQFFFHAGFLLVGDYGYGKTTFIDYLSNYLIGHDILPLRITTAKPYTDSSGFSDSFLHKLRMELKSEARRMTAVTESEFDGLELEDQIVGLCQKVISARRAGIVIFMDDYHKFRSHFPQIFEFLGTLQVLKDTLTRHSVNVGFIVSGIPAWLTEVRQNSQLTGFLDSSPIILPQISPELVCEVFNKRIAAYCYESTPRRIKPDFVRKLVKDLEGEQGIRGCITRIVSELSSDNTAIVDSPIEVPEDVLRQIKATFEKDPTVKAALNRLLFESRFKRFGNEQIARCLELLVHTNVQNGIPEADRQFVENKYYFQVLREANLIQKYKVGNSRSLKWNLQYRLSKLVQEIQEKHGLNLADYLLKLYAFKGYAEPSHNSTTGTGATLELKRFFMRKEIKLEKAVYEDIQRGIHNLEALLLRDQNRPPTEGSLKTAISGMEHLTNALFTLDISNIYFSHLGVTETAAKWILHPAATESISEAFQRVQEYERKRDLPHLSHAVKQMTNTLTEIALKIKALAEQMCESSNPLLHRPSLHTRDEVAIFQQIDVAYYSAVRADHFNYVRDLTDYLEIRLRKYFYFCGTLVFGDKYFEACPKSLVAYAHKNVDGRPNYSMEKNHFDGLTRSQFKTIFLENNSLREHFVKTLDLGWKEEDWKTFADMFAVENIKVAHQQVDTFSPTEKNRYRRYANLVEELLAAINHSVAHAIERRVYVCIASLESKAPADCLFQTSFKAVQILSEEGANNRVFSNWPRSFRNVDHLVSAEAYRRVVEPLKSKVDMAPARVITQDLLDTDYIQTHYRVSAVDFVNSLAYAKYVSRELEVQPWLGSSIAIRGASGVR